MSTSLDGVIDVVVFDERQLVHEGLQLLLSGRAGLRVVDTFAEAEPGRQLVTVIGESKSAPSEGRVVRLADVADLDDLVGCIVDGRVSRQVRDAPFRAVASLTAREQTVLRAVSDGASATEIATNLGISPRTVERHKQAVLAKLAVGSQARAVALTVGVGLLDDAV